MSDPIELPACGSFPKRGRIFGTPAPDVVFNRRDRLAFLSCVERYSRQQRRPGRPGGPLSANDLAVLKSLLLHQNITTGLCVPGVQRIADTAGAGLSKSTVYRSLDRLEQHGLITRIRRLKMQSERIRVCGQVTTRRRAVPDSNAYVFPSRWVKKHMESAGVEARRPPAYQATAPKCQGGTGTRLLELYPDREASGGVMDQSFTPKKNSDFPLLGVIADQMRARFHAQWKGARG